MKPSNKNDISKKEKPRINLTLLLNHRQSVQQKTLEYYRGGGGRHGESWREAFNPAVRGEQRRALG